MRKSSNSSRRRPVIAEAQQLWQQVAQASQDMESLLDETPYQSLCYPESIGELKESLELLQKAAIPMNRAMKREAAYFTRTYAIDPPEASEEPETVVPEKSDPVLPWHQDPAKDREFDDGMLALEHVRGVLGLVLTSVLEATEEENLEFCDVSGSLGAALAELKRAEDLFLESVSETRRGTKDGH